ncbi:MAG: hypothetical protein FWG67_01645 [Defluviitaleaceae bacterium]|nr:hypothetical protein [Defluviitaleaceae bacterium]
MILTYMGNDRPIEFEKGVDYFAFEIDIDLRSSRAVYRVVNSYGEIGCYHTNQFEMKTNSLEDMMFIENEELKGYTVRLKSIQELDDVCEDVNGVWLAYHDGNKELEDKIHEILKKQAEKEGFLLEKVVAV